MSGYAVPLQLAEVLSRPGYTSPMPAPPTRLRLLRNLGGEEALGDAHTALRRYEVADQPTNAFGLGRCSRLHTARRNLPGSPIHGDAQDRGGDGLLRALAMSTEATGGRPCHSSMRASRTDG